VTRDNDNDDNDNSSSISGSGDSHNKVGRTKITDMEIEEIMKEMQESQRSKE
jgi:hypothetical protein